MNEKNLILIDWLSFTVKVFQDDNVVATPFSVIELLGLESITRWTDMYGLHGYADRLYYEGINIHYNSKNSDIWVEMSGSGCRTFETYSTIDFKILFDIFCHDTQNYHVTRLDVAYDDKLGVLNQHKIERETVKGNYTTRFRDIRVEKSFSSDSWCMYYGSMKSDIMFRVYNKAVERGREDEGHWLRFEIQMRDEHALSFINHLNTKNIGILFTSVINNYLTYRKRGEDKNKSRWKVAKWWLDFIKNTESISLYTKCDKEYNFFNLHNYVVNQAGGAVETYLKLCGTDGLIYSLKSRTTVKNPKYTDLINDLKSKGAKINEL